ncbi:allantoinase AllB [Nocardia goodfellowii]|uniref:allantoinase n=1 Tax=Nocardia goodfellowii TaxID=882446 RepID=A0ABS4QMC3_9NOCA|nr:allantoinase AllB [Nocardia goodfellowii]MBP2192857.1 allantoinase [Nocardia goodfellowii]
MHDLVIRSRRVVLPEGIRPAAIAVRDGRIAAVEPYAAELAARTTTDVADLVLLPGLVDSHVHVNEPGRTEWEGFATATRAAAAGGVTTIIDMPLNSLPPTVDVPALAAKRAAAAGQCQVDVGFWGGAIPGNLKWLRPLHESGVFGFKCFLSPSGVDEFPPLTLPEIEAVMTELVAFDGLLIVHAEDPGRLGEPADGSYDAFLESRPGAAESAAVQAILALAEQTGARTHILHVSAADCLAPLAAAQARGVRITAETCPHYLTLAAAEAHTTAFKCCPPIRDSANQDALWQGLADGVLCCVVSDHSPCPPAMKEGDFASAWGGVSSLQLGLPAVWTAARARGFGLEDIVRWMAEAPADLVGLTHKGRIAVGCDADLVAFDPDAAFTVEPAALQHKNPITAYQGRELSGVVQSTWLRGAVVGERPAGRFIDATIHEKS